MLSPEVIRSIIPLPDLGELSHDRRENDNDIDVALDWLAPFFPSDKPLADPSARIRLALRSCTKDDASSAEFTYLYCNSVTAAWRTLWDTTAPPPRFPELLQFVARIDNYYRFHCLHLWLSERAADMVRSTVNGLCRERLARPEVTSALEEYLRGQLFTGEARDVVARLSPDRIAAPILQVVIKLAIDEIIAFVARTCRGQWLEPQLPAITDYVEHQVHPQFATIAPGDHVDDLLKIAQDELVLVRIAEIYAMVDAYPRLETALAELYQCFHPHAVDANMSTLAVRGAFSSNTHAYQRAKLVDTFIAQCHAQLLHAGRQTVDVVVAYTKTIKAFLIIDPKGVLLDKAVRPIRLYLKARPDVIPKLVHGLLDPSDANPLAELAAELRKGQRVPTATPFADALRWNPDPIDALPDFKKGKVADVIELLVLIFDSTEAFVAEFTKLFAGRLMAVHDYKIDDVVHHLGLVKLRFGPDEFAGLDVMVRDIRDSKLLNYAINTPKIHALVLSRHYWSNLDAGPEFAVPPAFVAAFDAYNQAYAQACRGRHLKLVPHLGQVKLNLSFGSGCSKKFECTPVQAAVVGVFDGAEHMEAAEVARQCGMSEYAAQEALKHWVGLDVLKEVQPRVYAANEAYEPRLTPQASYIFPFVRTILENIKCITYARIKPLLSLTVPRNQLDVLAMADTTLRTLLRELVDALHLEMDGSSYRLA